MPTYVLKERIALINVDLMFPNQYNMCLEWKPINQICFDAGRRTKLQLGWSTR